MLNINITFANVIFKDFNLLMILYFLLYNNCVYIITLFSL